MKRLRVFLYHLPPFSPETGSLTQDSCIPPSSIGVTDTVSTSQLLLWVLGVQGQVLLLSQQASALFFTVPPPRTLFYSVLSMKIQFIFNTVFTKIILFETECQYVALDILDLAWLASNSMRSAPTLFSSVLGLEVQRPYNQIN